MNDFVWKRDKGLNIVEKIEWKKALSKKGGLVQTFDGYFYEKLNNGVRFYIKETEMKS